MERMTRRTEAGFLLPSPVLRTGPDGFSGPAADRLGRLEELIERLEAENLEPAERMEFLRGQGRTRSCRFKEAMGLKGFQAHIPALLKKLIHSPKIKTASGRLVKGSAGRTIF